jgi:eukaryotic-like serine/threonine-protein kinase
VTITGAFVLPAGVSLIPAEDLPDTIRARLELENGDVAITRFLARAPSKIIDANAAALISEFKAPTTVVRAVIQFSRKYRKDPEETLLEALPLLESLLQAGLLLPADSQEAIAIRPFFEPGERADGYEVTRCLYLLDDTEIYQVKREDGNLAVLKLLRQGANPTALQMFARETAILRHLDGRNNPVLFDSGMLGDRPYLLLEWCEGQPATKVAEDLRDAPANARPALLQLCLRVLDAYAHLHAQDVLHGDVHPGNILVTDDGSVKIIDYGIAAWQGLDEMGVSPRGGVSFFFEPEYARALLADIQPPSLSVAGEQYSLAVLLYTLIAGEHYIDISLERDKMLRKIVEASPIPLSKHGTAPWTEVEMVLERALSKEPTSRYSSLREFEAQLRQVALSKEPVAEVNVSSVPVAYPMAEALLEEMLAQVRLKGLLFDTALPAPSSSVFLGAAGIAYALYRMALVREDASLLVLADLWANKALRESRKKDAFFNAVLEMTPETVGTITPFHTLSGVHLVQALIAHAMGNRGTQQAAVEQFVRASNSPCENLELTLGLSSTLIGASLLLDTMRGSYGLDSTSLTELGNNVMQSVWAQIDTYLSICDCRQIEYRGIAHGWAGILYSTLRWCASSDAPLPLSMLPRLEQLAELAEPFGRGVRWRLRMGQERYMSGWCHGSAGYVHLWTCAHRMFGDQWFLELAEKAGWNAWEGQDAPANLCCGQAGKAYAMLNLFKYTGQAHWLHKAQELANRAGLGAKLQRDWIREQGISLHSLYKGEVGIALLASELRNPEAACMPLFEAEGWTIR